MKIDTKILLGVIVLMIVAVCAIGVKEFRAKSACGARGGVFVHTVCIDKSVVINP